MKTLVTGFVLVILLTVSAFAAFPIGSTEVVVADATKVDFVGFDIKVFDVETGKYIGEIYNRSFGKLTLNGKTESVQVISRRSQTELAQAMEGKMREILTDVLANQTDLEGKRLLFGYDGHRWVNKAGQFMFFFATDNQFVVTKDETGRLVAPESASKVDLTAAVLYGSARVQVAPGVSQVEVTVRDESGYPLSILSGSGGYNPEGITLYRELNVFFLPRDLAVSGTKGDIRVWYADGKEELSSLADGHDLITYRSPPLLAGSSFKRLGVPRVTEKGIELPYEATDDEQVLIKRASPDFRTWEPLSVQASPIAGKTNVVRVRAVTIPLITSYGFFQATVTTNTVRKP